MPRCGIEYLMDVKPATLIFDAALSKAIWSEDRRRSVLVSAGKTIRQALEAEEIHLPRAAIALVFPQGKESGTTSDLDHVLQPGDCVRFLFQISGGSTDVRK